MVLQIFSNLLEMIKSDKVLVFHGRKRLSLKYYLEIIKRG